MSTPTQYWYVLEHHFANYEWQCAGNGYEEVSNDAGLLMDGIRWFERNTTPKPTQAELDALWASTYEAKCLGEPTKLKAKALISKTDWAVLSDVGLANQSAFVAYRAELRALITNPVAEPTWPVEPEPIWS